MTRKKQARDLGLPGKIQDSSFDRIAHSVWELRKDDEDETKHQLVRKIEEPAVDMRRTASKKSCTLEVGTRVAWVRKGEVAPAIVINVHQDAGTADVEFEDTCECERDIPMDMLNFSVVPPPPAPEPITPEAVMIETSPFEPVS